MGETKQLDLTDDETKLRCTGAVPMHIDYRVRPQLIGSRDQGSDIVFFEIMRVPPKIEVGVVMPTEDPVYLDAYKVRDAFEAADTEVSVRRFLSSVGEFWPGSSVRLSQFREWQAFVRLIRREDFDELAKTDRQAYQAGLAMHDWPNTFFNLDHAQLPTEWEERMVRESPELAEAMQEAEKWRQAQLKEVFQSFGSPTVAVGSRVTPEAIQNMERQKYSGPWPFTAKDMMPTLVYRPRYVLQAIAATISADKMQRIEYRACEGCGDLFRRKRDWQKCCERPGCKDKARAPRRKKSSQAARDFYTDKRTAGLEQTAIKQMATTEGLKLTARDIERAEKALARRLPKVDA
jgi:hypothetical protein